MSDFKKLELKQAESEPNLDLQTDFNCIGCDEKLTVGEWQAAEICSNCYFKEQQRSGTE